MPRCRCGTTPEMGRPGKRGGRASLHDLQPGPLRRVAVGRETRSRLHPVVQRAAVRSARVPGAGAPRGRAGNDEAPRRRGASVLRGGSFRTLPARGERRGSNPRPPGPQPGALPAELRPPSESQITGNGAYVAARSPRHRVGPAGTGRATALSGTPGWIRTTDLRIRRPLLYPAELQGRGPEPYRVRAVSVGRQPRLRPPRCGSVRKIASHHGALMPNPRVSSWKWWRMCSSRSSCPARVRGLWWCRWWCVTSYTR